MKPESIFEKNIETVASLCGCYYIKIPDVIPTKKYVPKAHKRPFDGIIITPDWNWLIECKIGYAKLKHHQKSWQDKINQTNGKFLVLRKIDTKDGHYYRIESNFGTWKTNEIKDIFEFCKLKHYKGNE